MTVTLTEQSERTWRTRFLVDVSSVDFACGICFPYQCSCNQPTSQHQIHPHSHHTQPPSPKKSFLTPFNQQHRTSLSKTFGSGRQTNIEYAKERHRGSIKAATAAGSCTRCNQPMPSATYTTRETNELNDCRSCHIITPEELSTHSTRTDLWVSLSKYAYNLTPFVKSHPGGVLPLLDVAGCDASDVFDGFHPAEVKQKLPLFQVGMMGEFDEHGRFKEGEWEPTELQKSFNAMVKRVEAAGLFETDMNYYYKKFAVLATMFASVIGLIVLGKCTTTYILSAVILGFFWQQLAFVGHDLGHNSVRGTAAKDWLAGLAVTGFFGVSVQWWKRNHNVHHVVTNSLEHDPDIQHLPVMTISEKSFDGYYSSYFETHFSMDALSRFLVGYQHLFYYPVMCIARVNLYAQSILLITDLTKQVRERTCEAAALAFFWMWYAGLSALLPDWPTRCWYFLLCHAVAGFVHVQITLSHFSMPVYSGRGYSALPSGRDHFLRCQFETSMDILCSSWLDWLHGGLQFQVTHHLMPRVPRHHLRQVREEYVKPFARENQLEYKEHYFLEANKDVYQRLKEAALASRQLPQKFTQSFLWQFMQADG